MQISKNSRQMPKSTNITKAKNYSDVLYAWLQCNSERVSAISNNRRIHKTAVNYSAIERAFTKIDLEGNEICAMRRRTIAKYFEGLLAMGLIEYSDVDGYYYLKVLDGESGHLIEYNTLLKLMNTLQKHAISIYIYLFNRYYACGCEPFIATIAQIKDFVGISTTTTSNNENVDDVLDILQRLGLLKFSLVIDESGKRHLQFMWVRNELP